MKLTAVSDYFYLIHYIISIIISECVCLSVRARVISKRLYQENGSSYGSDFLWYSFGKTLTKPISEFFTNRPVVSGSIDGFVPQM